MRYVRPQRDNFQCIWCIFCMTVALWKKLINVESVWDWIEMKWVKKGMKIVTDVRSSLYFIYLLVKPFPNKRQAQSKRKSTHFKTVWVLSLVWVWCTIPTTCEYFQIKAANTVDLKAASWTPPDLTDKSQNAECKTASIVNFLHSLSLSPERLAKKVMTPTLERFDFPPSL